MSKTEERECVVLQNEGQKIFGILHRPHVPTPFPAVLMCHGLGGHKAGKYRLYVTLAEKLSAVGIASLRIDFRGSGDSEGNFGDMTLDGEAKDAEIALKYLRERSDINSQRVGIFGRSVGGTVALMAADRVGGLKSIAIWAPLFDGDQWMDQWRQLHRDDVSEEHRLENMRINGQVPGKDFFMQLFSLNMPQHLHHIENIPMLHIHGEKDNIVTISHADKYIIGRKKAKAENKFIRLPTSDHDFSHSKEQVLALDETVNWFSKTL